MPSPAIAANGTVVVGSNDGSVYAVNVSTGALIWSFATGGPVVSSPAISFNAVYVGSVDGKVYALNVHSGVLLWSHTTLGAVYASPTIGIHSTVYFISEDHYLYALDGATGVSP